MPQTASFFALISPQRRQKLLAISLIFTCLPHLSEAKSTATDTACNSNYFNQQPPAFLNPKLGEDAQPLCFDGFAVMYSGKSKTALWSAEYLTKDRLNQASTLERVNNFHSDARLPNSIRAELADYSHSEYDRGHLAPNGDMATTTQQYDSFSLANIVPQNPQQNRNLWKNLETQTRTLAIKNGKAYVVTGVAFNGKAVKQLNNRILIPTHLYKAIYIPSLQQAGVYYAPNDDSQRVEVISLNELSQRTGVDVFPNLPANTKATVLQLPVSNASPSPKAPSKEDTANTNLIIKLINAIINWLASLFK